MRRILLLTQRLDASDANLGFVCGWVEALAQSVQVRVVTLGAGRGRWLAWWRMAQQVARVMRRETPDVILAHMCPEYALLAAPCAWWRRVPIVLWYAHTQSTWALQLAARVAQSVVTPLAGVVPLPPARVRVVGHGIDIERYVPLPDSSGHAAAPYLLAVGRITPAKHQDVLIDALQQLHRVLGAAAPRLRIVGGPITARDHAYAASLRERIHRAGLEAYVEWVGPVPPADVVPHYQRCVCVVSASATPDKVVLEAMACGALPVLSNVAFAPVLGEQTGRALYRAGDAQALADRVCAWLATATTTRAAVGATLRAQVVADHSLAHLVSAFTAVCDTVTASSVRTSMCTPAVGRL